MQTIIAEIEWKVVVDVFIATHLLNLIEPAVSLALLYAGTNEHSFQLILINYSQQIVYLRGYKNRWAVYSI